MPRVHLSRSLIVVTVSAALGAALAAQPAPRAYPTARSGGNYMHNYYFPPAPSSTPWAPAWSPDGKWIAVAMGGSIWKVDPATGVAHELTLRRASTTRRPPGRPTATGSSTRPTMAARPSSWQIAQRRDRRDATR